MDTVARIRRTFAGSLTTNDESEIAHGDETAAAPVEETHATRAASQSTITLKQIAAELAARHELPRKQAECLSGNIHQ